MKATFFSQQAIFCPQCQTRYTLGRFTRSQMGHFAQQSMLAYWERELAILQRVQNLFTRYPLIQALYLENSVLRFYERSPLEARLHAEIPEAANWTLTDEDKEVLDYLDKNSFDLNPRLASASEARERLSNEVRQSPVFCLQCERIPLQLDENALSSSYLYALREFSPSTPEKIPMGCWISPFLMGLVGVRCLFFFNGTSTLVGLAFLSLTALSAMFLWENFPWRRSKKVVEEPIENQVQIFRGRYFTFRRSRFEWKTGKGQEIRCCELLIPDKAGWQWLEDAREQSKSYRWDFSATFDLESEGVLLYTGRFGHRESLQCRVEVTHMRSVRLVKVDGAVPPSEELLRSSQASGTNQEELLRPTVEIEEASPDELLRGSEPP